MKTKERIMLESKAWRQEKLNLDENYFERLNSLHTPKILWIASSDSLASFREMTNMEPGEIIVYRNIGAQVKPDDMSLLAVIEHAIEVQDIKHIVVCGYSQCSGVRAILDGEEEGAVMQEWLKDLRAIYETNKQQLEALPREERQRLLGVLNIEQQVRNLSEVPTIEKAWRRSDYPRIYGWYFDLKTGSLQEVCALEANHRKVAAADGSRIKTTAS